ncbi:MAG: cytochrome c biogenesis protein DipZ [Actinomycetota bacterium]|nr:cytochrome c biogenesis protein DipZ [Actinomycetota bacterium]
MVVLLGIGFLAGIITSISPCVLPVLPILFAGSASGGRRRPYTIIAGVVIGFSAFLLAGGVILDRLGLPQDLLRDVALALLFLVAATLLVPKLGEFAERPFYALTRRQSGDLGGGFLLGLSLGLVFVPCAGPVLAAITVLVATHDVGLEGVLLTASYALGAAVPMLLLAVAGQRALARARFIQRHALGFRRSLGLVVGATALLIALNLDEPFQTAIPGYTNALQTHVENNAYASRQLAQLTRSEGGVSEAADEGLDDFGSAPNFHGIKLWLNTPGGRPLSMPKLRGKVVLVDFWTYSCINCLRTLPHLEGWDDAYRKAGLVIVGVHTPEFAFESAPSNVRAAVERLGVRYPVALDNRYETWNAYANRYWPADYLIDRRGHVRFAHFGEGKYGETESVIRRLLAEQAKRLPSRTRSPDLTPTHPTTPESYLGYARLAANAGMPVHPGRWIRYALPSDVPLNELAYGGVWRIEDERAIAGRGARLRLHFSAQDVFLVLSGRGRVRVSVNGAYVKTVRVDGSRLYTLLRRHQLTEALLDLRFTPGIAGYAFTFG